MQRSTINSYIFQNMSNMFRLNLFLIWLHCKYQHHPVPPRAPTRHWIIPWSSFCQSLTCSFEQKLHFCLMSFGQKTKFENSANHLLVSWTTLKFAASAHSFLYFSFSLKSILHILLIGASIIWRVSTVSIFHLKVSIKTRLLIW